MSKPLIFISHISEEKEVALAFKDLIEGSFLGMIDLFVSSDASSVPLGQKWLDGITLALRNCILEIVVCSPKSVARPWINFEAGSGWVRDIPVIPLCHSGIEPSTLPLPLNLLQAVKANETSSLKPLLPVLAQAIGARTPSVDFTGFIDRVVAFEARYMFWDQCNAAFKAIHAINPGIIPNLQQGKQVKVELTETQINQLEKFIPNLQQHDILQLLRTGDAKVSNKGTFYGFIFIPMPKLEEILRDERFRL